MLSHGRSTEVGLIGGISAKTIYLLSITWLVLRETLRPTKYAACDDSRGAGTHHHDDRNPAAVVGTRWYSTRQTCVHFASAHHRQPFPASKVSPALGLVHMDFVIRSSYKLLQPQAT